MTFGSFIASFFATFVITFIVNLVVVFLWNLIFHGTAEFDWETAFQFAIILGVILPLIQGITRKKQSQGSTPSG
jgi:hypothetical protein